MNAPPKKTKAPGGTSAEGFQEEEIKSRNSATGAARWEYRVRQVLGRFLVISPMGIVREDCAAEASAQQLATALNGRAGLEALA